MEHRPYRLAEDFDGHLGDPRDPSEPFSFARCLELDEKEEFPDEICRRLDEWGLSRYYVPARHGGRLSDYEQLLQLMRGVARRDLTVAVGHGKTYLGAVCAWVAGESGQAERLAQAVTSGVPVSLALTERAHGSDLLAGEVQAHPAGGASGGRLVSGEKWLINNATRGGMLSVLARTAPGGGPRGFSMFLVDKRRLAEGTFRHLPKVHTHGIRGADISGIVLDGAHVPDEALIGTEGGGIETVLKALQLTRTLCAALSLGAADHGLALAADFVEERELYGRRLVELPQARRVLAEASADVLLHEALAVVASRAVHTLTGELSLTSAVTKYLLPSGTEDVLAALTRLLGARAFLKGVHAGGMFQKLERDHRIVGIFDGNTLVNLNSLVSQFRSLARCHRRGTADTAGASAAYDLSVPLPEMDPGALSLVARRGSGVLASLEGSVAELARQAAGNGALAQAAAAAERLLAVTARLHTDMAEGEQPVGDVPPAAFETARRYTLCYAAAAVLGLWTHNAEAARQDGTGGDVWHDGLWLRTALDRLLVRLGEPGAQDPDAYEGLLTRLRGARASGELFALFPQRLPGGAPQPGPQEHAQTTGES